MGEFFSRPFLLAVLNFPGYRAFVWRQMEHKPLATILLFCLFYPGAGP